MVSKSGCKFFERSVSHVFELGWHYDCLANTGHRSDSDFGGGGVIKDHIASASFAEIFVCGALSCI